MDSALLTSEALKLPPFERAQMIEALWRSLDPAEQNSIDEAWIVESLDRLKAYREGKLHAHDGEATLRDLEASLRR